MNEYLNKKRLCGDYGKQETLPPSLQTKMNQSFGMDFSNIKLYRNDEMAGTGMKGLASGNRVILSREVDLNSKLGQTILGHELSHIHAQSQGIGGGHSGLYNNAALERQADTEGVMAANGQPIFGDRSGMNTGSGMGGLGTLTPLSGGLAPNAGAPMQAWLWNKNKADPPEAPAIPEAPAAPESYDPVPMDGSAEDYLSSIRAANDSAKWEVPERTITGEEPPPDLTSFFDILTFDVNELCHPSTHPGMLRNYSRIKNLPEVSKGVPADYRLSAGHDFLSGSEQATILNMEAEAMDFYQSLSAKEQMALLRYTRGGDYDMNMLKRAPGSKEAKRPFEPKVEEKTRALDHALDRYTLKNDLTVYRGLTLSRMLKPQNKEVKKDMTGEILTDPGYMSTSLDRIQTMSWKDADTMLEIHLKAGDHVGAPIMDMSAYTQNEAEFLLSAGQSLKVVSEKISVCKNQGREIEKRTLVCEPVRLAEEGVRKEPPEL